MKQIINKILYLKKYIFEHLLRYSIITILFLIIIIGLLKFTTINNIFQNENIVSQQIFIYGLSLENFFSITSLIALFFTAIWAMYQYDKNIKIKQQEKASKIMEKFSNDIVAKIAVIDSVFDKCPIIENILPHISNKKSLNFNIYEMNTLISETDISTYSSFLKDKNTDELYKKILDNLSFDIKPLPPTFSSFIINTLNELEAICMDISSSAAGTPFIYDSLHTLFFNFTQKLYIKISSLNSDNIDTMFTNVINVYNSWMIKKYKDYKKYIKIKNKIKKIDIKSKKMIQKLLNKKPSKV